MAGLATAALPLVAAALVWVLIAHNRSRLGLARLSVRGALAAAFVLFQGVLMVMTEALSGGHRLARAPVTITWVAATVVLAATAVATGALRTVADWVRSRVPGTLRELRAHPWVAVAALAMAAIFLALVVMACWYRPNNPDSLVYHLTRVAHWVQNQSVEHFATHTVVMVDLAPLHEINMLHLHLLAGTDALDGFVQLAGFVIGVLGVSEVARLLGARAEVQVGAALMAISVPSALLEATSTQNNLFAASVAVGLVVIALGWEPGGSWVFPSLLLGVGGAAGFLVKGSVLPMVGPALLVIALWAGLAEKRLLPARDVLARVGGVVVVASFAALVVAGPFLHRNLDVFDSVQGSTGKLVLNGDRSARDQFGNVVRSVAGQLRVGDGSGFEAVVSRTALGVLETVYRATGADPDDPAFAIGADTDAFARGDHGPFARTEDYGANPWHALLIGISAVGLPIIAWARRRGEGDGGQRSGEKMSPCWQAALGGGLLLGFVVFAGTTKWSHYAVRYHLPLLLLWAPLVAIVLARVHRRALGVVVVGLVVASASPLLNSTARPLLERRVAADVVAARTAPRVDGFPVVPPEAFAEVASAIAGMDCDRVGIASVVGFEYLLWVALDAAGWDGEIRHVGVGNETGVLEDLDYDPCAVVQDQLWYGPPPEPGEMDLVVDSGGLLLWQPR